MPTFFTHEASEAGLTPRIRAAMADEYVTMAGPIVLLCHPLLARKLGQGHALDVRNLRIDWDDLGSRCFSSTEVLLFDAARCLARGEPCDLGRLVRGLDPDPWQWLMAALAVARGERRLEDLLG